jgi:hypothetical protein
MKRKDPVVGVYVVKHARFEPVVARKITGPVFEDQ